MGNPISKIREEAEAADKQAEQELQQRLQILEKMIHYRLQNEETQILAGVRGDQEIHTETVVQMRKQVNIKLASKESQELKDAIGDFFSGDLTGGLEKIVQVGAETVLGNDSMGEYETNDMIIVWTSNALLRCDAYYYRWNFVSTGVIDRAEGVVGVLLVKRVIDVTKTDPQVLTWAISSLANRLGRPDDASKMIDEAMKILDKVVAFQANLKEVEEKSGVGPKLE